MRKNVRTIWERPKINIFLTLIVARMLNSRYSSSKSLFQIFKNWDAVPLINIGSEHAYQSDDGDYGAEWHNPRATKLKMQYYLFFKV